jgi:hypothetical protein
MSIAQSLVGPFQICVVGSLLWALAGASPALAQDEEAAESSRTTVGQYARYYRGYRRDIDELRDMSFMSSDEVENAHELIMSYEPPELTRGWMAHQAMVASRAPGFMDTVRSAAAQRGQANFFETARRDSSYLWALSSNTAAINYVFDGLYQDAREARAVGRVLNDRAYAYMDSRYGSRLPAGAVTNATELLGEDEDEGERSYEVPYRAQQVMQRVLELAARLSLDRSGGQSLNAAGLLAEDMQTNQCLRWARLNLAQCIAASRTTAEEAYCTGLHGVDDVSNCWGWIVNMDGEIEQAALAN